MTLAEFLLARIAEKATVRRTLPDAPHRWWSSRIIPDGMVGVILEGRREILMSTTWQERYTELVPADARSLAECEALRRIVTRCTETISDVERGLAHDVLNDLASPYVSHPDYPGPLA